MSNGLLDTQTSSLLRKDKELLEKTRFPIVTVSSSFREEIKQFHNMEHDQTMRDVVFSRAHFSMAIGVMVQAWEEAKHRGESKKNLKPHTHELSKSFANPTEAWLIDPTNYVSSRDWSKITNVEYIGRKLARNTLLKWIKDKIDTFVRGRLPITSAITPPLLHVFQSVERPIISLHYEAGNILASVGKKVVQVVTDPHVRDQYLLYADLPNIKFCVFDEKTREDFLEKAKLMGKIVDPARVIVTGPPVDPRVVAARAKKSAENMRKRPLRICITTGGLGTNKHEISDIFHELFDLLRKHPRPIQMLGYGGTNHDFTVMAQAIAKDEHVAIAPLDDETASFRFIHGKHIFEINELLLRYGFPWADVFITKPSGDMAYDAASAGCAMLFLSPWGEWEENIQEVFEQRGIARKAVPKHITEQVSVLLGADNPKKKNTGRAKSWFELAQKAALQLPPQFTSGSMHILDVAKNF
jgi:hypothetical protein